MRLTQATLTNPRRTLLWVALLALTAIAPGASWGAGDRDAGRVSVIVRAQPNAGGEPERLVERLGGRVGRRIGIINGFVATVPRHRLRALERGTGVHSVTRNRRVRLHALLDGWDQAKDAGSIFRARESTNVDDILGTGVTGKGVDVALIDSGVAPVNGLTYTGKVVNGADLSFESQAPNLRYLDTFGHGTHLAGIIAGRDNDADPKHDANRFVGVAPEARIVSVKVADAHGLTDVSQILAAIDWVVEHRKDNGLNIRVLNLAFGTDGSQPYLIDPLAYAVEVAWRKGIAVVVAAGNGGSTSPRLNNPAYDPYVIAVGAVNTKATPETTDDVVPAWSSSGDGVRNPDVVAPGKSIVSLRVPGSHIDQAFPIGRVGKTRFFRGSGTSQATAFVSGLAALVIHQRPTITPDQLKALLRSTAQRIPNVPARLQGEGVVNGDPIARRVAAPLISTQLWGYSTGLGLLEEARGSVHLVADSVVLRGERDIFGRLLSGSTWAPESLVETTWNGGTWNGNAWTGNAWTANAWSGNAWEANAWEANAWSGNAWESNAWSANAWTGNAWSGNAWEANAWEANAWESNAWAGNAWSTRAWGG